MHDILNNIHGFYNLFENVFNYKYVKKEIITELDLTEMIIPIK